MSCNQHKDNRHLCGSLLPSGCIPYTGYLPKDLKDKLDCKPNINDIFKDVLEAIEDIKKSLGDVSKTDFGCYKDYKDNELSQEDINSILYKELCVLKESVKEKTLNPDSIRLVINLLCLEEPGCDSSSTYTIRQLFDKLIAAYCSLLARVKNIETILNI